ncbi:hypothetical protein [Algoriphagus terrigena]|uniref:hypothetical protein n=1 Tax=Algoriphagus terrigena TaxID=344884 RepID=UPI000402C3E6|nr:hypothetical protein [Algoriphagus terrigena]
MKRRTFLKTFPVFAATPLAMAAIPASSPAHSRHLIALGTAACRSVAKDGEKLNFDSFTLIDGELPSQVNVHAKFFRFIPPEYLYEPYEHVRFLKKEPLPILPIPQDIETHLRTLEGELVFLAGLGRATGTLLFQSLGLHYRTHTQGLEWLATMPFYFEGIYSRKNADQAIYVLADNRREPTSHCLDEIRHRYGNLALRSAYEKADEWIVSELNEI